MTVLRLLFYDLEQKTLHTKSHCIFILNCPKLEARNLIFFIDERINNLQYFLTKRKHSAMKKKQPIMPQKDRGDLKRILWSGRSLLKAYVQFCHALEEAKLWSQWTESLLSEEGKEGTWAGAAHGLFCGQEAILCEDVMVQACITHLPRSIELQRTVSEP